MSGKFVGEGFESLTVVCFKLAEYIVFQFVIHKYENEDIQNFSFTFCFVWVWNLVFHTEGRT
jgi:hypothetical protein